jgi:hypothetical protein
MQCLAVADDSVDQRDSCAHRSHERGADQCLRRRQRNIGQVVQNAYGERQYEAEYDPHRSSPDICGRWMHT